LADEFIPKSLSALADNGYFLEMGKRDDWDQEKVSQLNATHKYYRYDLGTEMVNQMTFIGSMLKDLIGDIEKGELKPLPIRIFPMESVRDAFRYMAQAKHIGKIVITQAERASMIDPHGTYLITGGLGGLGMVTARWMVEKGANHIVLMSRSEPTEQARQVLDELRQDGAEIVTMQGDVARRADVEHVLTCIKETLPPLRGLFHEAGVLDDGVLSKQDWSRFERVLNPKVSGAWHLHELTQSDSLDFFILFSSAAAVAGSAGQGNYAAANSFLDGLAHYRKAHGLPAMSINWGAWAEVGMAAALDSHRASTRPARGVGVIKPADGTRILEQVVTTRPTQMVVLPIDWNKFGYGQSEESIQPLFKQLVKKTKQDAAPSQDVNILERLETLSFKEQETALQEYLWHQVTRILALDSSQSPDPLKLLTDLGMDSLMAVELKNKIEGDLGINVPVTYFLEDATIAELSRKLHDQLGNEGMINKTTIDNDTNINSEKAKVLLENLDQLSEDDVDSLLNNLLTKNEES
jgi:myxalamid-type polyketide synthase MxaB